ncbi:MAG: hypothetical protein RIT27_694 [Pseudomonadota bacterium]|jgi:succinate dehydrogenase hydrophobic anchor subunit
MFHQKGSSNFLLIAVFAIILTSIAIVFLYLEFEGIDKSGIRISPDIKQLSEEEKKKLLEKLHK